MSNQIYTATGCARCKITKAFMQQRDITYEEFDFKAEGKDAFAKFYRENRKDIYRDKDGVEFPVFSDGTAIRQGVSVIIGYLIAGNRLKGFIGPNSFHGEWIDGFDISGGDPEHTDALLAVLDHLKQNGLKIQATTDGRNAAVLERVQAKDLADRVIMEVRGPAGLYEELTGAALAEEELKACISLAARFPEYQFKTSIAPLKRKDGTVNHITPEEIGETAQLIAAATGSKKHPYRLGGWDPKLETDNSLKDVDPLPASALFRYRTAARRYMVMTEIEK